MKNVVLMDGWDGNDVKADGFNGWLVMDGWDWN